MHSSYKNRKKSKVGTYVSKAIKKIQSNKTSFLTIIGFLAGFLILGIFIYSNLSKINEGASISLSNAYMALSSGDFQNAIANLDITINNYKNTPAAYNARLLKADYLTADKKYEEAFLLLKETFEKGKPAALRPLALVRIIYLYDQQKDYENAVFYANKFVSKYKKHFFTKNIYLNLADFYLKLGSKDDAIRVYTGILMQYPASDEANIAEMNIEALNK